MAEINEKTSFDFKPKSDAVTMGSIARNREQLMKDVSGLGSEQNQVTDELKKQIEFLNQIEKRTKSQDRMLRDAKKIYEQINDIISDEVVNYQELLNKNTEAIKMSRKLRDEETSLEIQKAQLIEDRIEREKEINRIHNERNNAMDDYDELLNGINEKLKAAEIANKSMIEAFSKNINSIKNQIRDLAVVKGVGDLTQGLFGNSNSSMLTAYYNSRSQLGLTESGFNTFKKDLYNKLDRNNMLTEFSWKDTADYIAKLGDLGITSQEMAEEQYLAIMQGTKYLGLSTDTQAKMLRIARNTGQGDLLQKTNETIVQIMNAQLGVSKQQLDTMLNQAAGITEMTTFLGGSPESALALEKMQAAITSEYGEKTNTAAMNILQDIVANPYSSKYITGGYLGGSYNDILGLINSDQSDKALLKIVEAVQKSNVTQVAKGNVINAAALQTDANVMAIGNASGNSRGVYDKLTSVENASNNVSDAIGEFNKKWSDKVINAVSNFVSKLPFSQVLSLQNVYYGLALVELLVKTPATLKGMWATLKSIDLHSKKSSMELDSSSTTSLSGMLSSKLNPLVAISAGITSLMMFMNDAKNGKNNADKWGTGKTSAAIGGFIGGTDDNTLSRTLKNAGKYALAGAALGSFFPGIGNVAGWVIGGLIGLVAGGTTGAIGGENIANGLDDMFGRRKDTDSSGDAFAPVVSSPSKSSYSGRGEPISRDAFPWTLTSPFGYRGVLQTSAGPTNPYHKGIDLAHPDGTPIGANNAGTVSSAGTASDGANYVIVNSGNGYEQIYWHLNQPSHLKKGDVVNEGQLIGYMGSTGHATGPHLHFGLRKAGTSNYVDPINSINSGVFYPSEDGYTSTEISENKEGEKLLEKVVSADTLSNEAASLAYSGIGSDNSDVVTAVNSGFAGLNAKLEELSNRQDNQEDILKQLTSRGSREVYKY